MANDALTGLRDVDDVHGSFLLNGGGELVARDLPTVFQSDIFSEIGPRIMRLRETLETDSDGVNALTLRFSEHKLHLRSVAGLVLGVVTSAKVNGPALRMAINLVVRRVAQQAEQFKPVARAPAPAPTVPQPPVGTRRAPGVTGRDDIMFKGRRL